MTDRDQQIQTHERDFVLTRTFDAPRDLVFAAHTTCEHLRHWWGPSTWPMVECTIDFRVGGTWHYCLRGPNEGDASWGRAVYTEIVAPERIAYTDAFSDETGVGNEEMPQSSSTILFEDRGGSTVITIRASYPSAEDLKGVLDMGMIAGLTDTLDRLQAYVTGEEA